VFVCAGLKKIFLVAGFGFLSMLSAALAPDVALCNFEKEKIPVLILQKDDAVASWSNLNERLLCGAVVKNIHSYESQERYSLLVGDEVIVCSASQKFLPQNAVDFVYASNVTPGMRLQTISGACVECKEVIVSSELTIFVDVTLNESPIFFVGKYGLVTHNVGFLLPSLIVHIETWLAGAVIAQLFFGSRPPAMFKDFSFGRSSIIEMTKRFAYEDYPWSQFDMYSPSARISSKVAGIDVDPAIVGKYSQYGCAFGPMCATAELNDDGTVECSVNIFRYLRTDPEYSYFTWQRIGNKSLTRDDPFIKEYVEQEDRKLLAVCTQHVDLLPAEFHEWSKKYFPNRINETVLDLSEIYDDHEFLHGGLRFLPCALLNMVKEKFSPHLVNEVYFCGARFASQRRHHWMFIYSQKRDLCMVVNGQDVVLVGRYSTSMVGRHENVFNTYKTDAEFSEIPKELSKKRREEKREKKENKKTNSNNKNSNKKPGDQEDPEDEKEKMRRLRKEKEEGNKSSQAPGMPTERDGFRPPKNWNGEKVSTSRGYGYPDKDGNVWIPTGPNGHGGPHWDVQLAGGAGYRNVRPDGGFIL